MPPKRILWLSRHRMLKSEIEALKAHFGSDVLIFEDVNPFSHAEDIASRFRKGPYDDIGVVAPLSVLSRLVELGIKPLWAEMVVVPPDQAEVEAAGRHYRFVRWKRIKAVNIEFEEI